MVTRNNVGAILIDQVNLCLPDGSLLTQSMNATILAGQRILVTGPSGCGKSTLFRALAGIWPYGEGFIEIPKEMKLLFLPQRSYLPIGTLRAAINYPASGDAYKDRAIQHYLEQCKLPHLIDSLDEIDNWSTRLSPGEQQRLAFVRALLSEPDVLFLDEASSALDADTEQALYELVLAELPHASIISIAHRDIVARHHQLHWRFEADADARFSINTTGLIKAGKAA
jgi:putative ATP-binding cassette transporter